MAKLGISCPKKGMMNIPITRPVFDEDEKDFLLKPLETGWVVQGPYVREFEKMFAEFTGVRFARATTSCTAALHLALEASGITRGHKVIVPSFTYVASANAVEYTGAEAVFCDIDLRTFNIDIQKATEILEKDAEGKIKAIMPVDLFGLCADMPAVRELAREYNLKVIEDAACGFGSRIGGRPAGTWGEAGCFSFHPRKVITTGEGGMLITNSEGIAKKVSSLRDHGAGKSDFQRHREKGGSLLPEFNLRGYNYRMNDFQGALGVAQMKKAEYIIEQRRKTALKYNEALKGVEELVVPFVPDNYTHTYQSYVCLFTGGHEEISRLSKKKIDRINGQRNRFMYSLESKGIAARQGTHAVHALGYYKNKYNLKNEDCFLAYAADRLSITFPLYAQMTDTEFEYVIEGIRSSICVE